MTKVRALLVGLMLSTLSVAGQEVFQSMIPPAGSVGAAVSLHGAGFDPSASYELRINGSPAAVESVAVEQIVFSIGPETESGRVELVRGGVSIDTGFTFFVRRELVGTLVLPVGLSPERYLVTGSSQLAVPEAGSGRFVVPVTRDRAQLLMAVGAVDVDPVFLAVATGAVDAVRIDASSTAEALVFLSPLLASRDDTVARSRMGRIAGLPETKALADVIRNVSSEGRSYFSDQRYRDALFSAIQAAVRPDPLGPRASVPTHLLQDLNPDYVGFIPSTPTRLMAALNPPPRFHPNDLPLVIDSVGVNPVDWFVEVFELQLDQFPEGKRSIEALTHESLPLLRSRVPIGVGSVPAKLVGANGDLLGRVNQFLTGHFQASLDPDGVNTPNTFLLDKDLPGAYLVQAYSGNYWYGGTRDLLRNRNQVTLLESVDHNNQWQNALVLNELLIALDIASFVIDVGSLIDNELPAFLQSVLGSMNTAMVRHRQHPDGLTLEILERLVSEAVGAIVSWATQKGFTVSFDALSRIVFGSVETVGSVFDAVGRVSAGIQIAERFAGIGLPDALAIERSVVLVGDPFRPQIVDFEPKAGRAGDRIRILGTNFPEEPRNATVRFCQFAQSIGPDDDPETIPFTSELLATVVDASPTSLLVEVPSGWETVFAAETAFICVSNARGDESRTFALEDPHRLFRHIPAPTLEAVSPNPTIRGGLLEIQGKRFGRDPLLNRVTVDSRLEATITGGSDERLAIRLPEGLEPGVHTVEVAIASASSNVLPFTIMDPVGEVANGLKITVNALDLTDKPDGRVSLWEAMRIANGTLGRPIEQHAPCELLPVDHPDRCPLVPRETDFIEGDNDEGSGGGVESRDQIAIDVALAGQELVLDHPLPPMQAGDHFDFGGVVLNGRELPSESDGLHFAGTSHVSVRHVTLKEFSGAGVYLSEGASGNSFDQVTVIRPGGDGIFLEGNAPQNDFLSTKVQEAGRHGLHLSGPEVRLNNLALPSIGTNEILGLAENGSGYGVVLSDGASFNSVNPGTVRNNAMGGVLVTGEETDFNVIGRNSRTVPRFVDIYSNQGHGVHLTAGVEHTVVRHLNPAGNAGDGIRLEGPDCAFNQVDGIFTGMDFFSAPGPPVQLPNTGSGIHLLNGAHHNLIGNLTGAGGRSAIVGNGEAGVLVEGEASAFNTLNRMNVGDLRSSGRAFGYVPNGTHGIHLRNGAHDNEIGNYKSYLDLHIVGQPRGAGILIEGQGTDRNRVIGAQIGTIHGDNFFPQGLGVLNVGIHLRDGVRDTVIGAVGQRVIEPGFGDAFQPYNVIGNATRAGILLEGVGGHRDENGVIHGANVIVNNSIGVDEFDSPAGNLHGIEITGGARLNRIGGSLPSEANRIRFNRDAGIAIIANPLDRYEESNQILNNRIANTGIVPPPVGPVGPGGPGGPPPVGPPPMIEPGAGVGVLLRGSTRFNRVGEAMTSANVVERNTIGVLFDGAAENQLQAAKILQNSTAGIILRGAERNIVGAPNPRGAVHITGNGSGGAESAGILIQGGGGNWVQSSYIGDDGSGNAQLGNQGDGIHVVDSSENMIGGESPVAGNVIGNNQVHGVHITGPGAQGNRVRFNSVGVGLGNQRIGNRHNGILLANGASGNVVGGKQAVLRGSRLVSLSVGNQIENNEMNGIEVLGAATIGNAILDNRVTQNAMAGIAHTSGGNENVPPPLQATYDGRRLNGAVPDLGALPVGSLIQVFADSDRVQPEGAVMLGEARVQPGGSWEMSGLTLPPFPTLTMTGTHATSGSTSTFGTELSYQPAIAVRRSGSTAVGDRTVARGPGLASVFRFTVAAENAEGAIRELVFETSGGLDEGSMVLGAWLYHDADSDGEVSPGDRPLAEMATFTQNDGELRFVLDDGRLRSNQSQPWLLAYDLQPSAVVSAPFQVQLAEVAAVRASFVLPVNSEAPVRGQFPIESDRLLLGEATAPEPLAGMDAWKAVHFSVAELADEAVSGDAADPDGDGTVNLAEYALGLNPRVADQRELPAASIEGEFLEIVYPRAKDAAGVRIELSLSFDLESRGELTGLFEEVGVESVDAVRERVRLRGSLPVQTFQSLFVVFEVVRERR